MNCRKFLVGLFAATASLTAFSQTEPLVWHSEFYPRIDSVSGSPDMIGTPIGAAVRFNGVDDAVFIDENPIRGLREFTVEVIFRPDGSGPFAQRFLHMGTSRGERIVLETRLNEDKTWYFDAHTTLSDGKKITIIDEKLTHPADRWYNVTLVVYRDRMVTYVNGKPQRWANADFIPLGDGITSVGVRQNLVDWFKGDIFKIRITPSGLLPRDFLMDHELLNEMK